MAQSAEPGTKVKSGTKSFRRRQQKNANVPSSSLCGTAANSHYIPLRVIEEVVDKEVVAPEDDILFGDDGGGKVATVQKLTGDPPLAILNKFYEAHDALMPLISSPLLPATATTDVNIGVAMSVGDDDYVVSKYSEYSPTKLNLKGDFDEASGGADSDENFAVEADDYRDDELF
jgi:hypothetical protein